MIIPGRTIRAHLSTCHLRCKRSSYDQRSSRRNLPATPVFLVEGRQTKTLAVILVTYPTRRKTKNQTAASARIRTYRCRPRRPLYKRSSWSQEPARWSTSALPRNPPVFSMLSPGRFSILRLLRHSPGRWAFQGQAQSQCRRLSPPVGPRCQLGFISKSSVGSSKCQMSILFASSYWSTVSAIWHNKTLTESTTEVGEQWAQSMAVLPSKSIPWRFTASSSWLCSSPTSITPILSTWTVTWATLVEYSCKKLISWRRSSSIL